MMFPKFWTQSDIDWSVKLDNSGSYDVRSEMEWLVFCIVLSIGFPQNTPNDSSQDIMMFPKCETHSDIDWSVKLHNSANHSSNHIMMFPMFWTQSDIDWSVKLDD
ncbi:unnamed protein product [Prunus armeniaca]